MKRKLQQSSVASITALVLSLTILFSVLLPQIQRKELKVTPNMSGVTITSLVSPQSGILGNSVRGVVSKAGCKATWYGNEFNGRLSANGEVFDEMGMTAASNTLAFGTLVRVTNTANGQMVVVRITDRGGFTHCFDLSKGAFMQLDDLSRGVLYVNYEIL